MATATSAYDKSIKSTKKKTTKVEVEDERQPCDASLVPFGNNRPLTKETSDKRFIRKRPILPSTPQPEDSGNVDGNSNVFVERRSLRNIPRVDYTEPVVPDADHFFCKLRKLFCL